MDRPPLGCSTCRDSKVKYDMQQPACLRCVRLQLDCPGYPDPWDVLHREQNSRAASQVAERVRRIKAERRDKRRAEKMESQLLRTMMYRIDVEAEVYCISALFGSFSDSSGIMVFDVLPQLHAGHPAACFSHALKAAALANAAIESRQPGLLTDARRAYKTCISSLRQAMESPGELRDDSVLMAVFLTGFFTFTLRSLPGAEMRTIGGLCPHAAGAQSLIQYRVQTGLDNEIDRELFVFCRHIGLIVFFSSENPMDPGCFLTEFGAKWNTWTYHAALDSSIGRAIVVMGQLRSASRSRNESSENVARLGSETFGVFDELICATSCIHWNGSCASRRTAFNGLIGLTSAKSVAIAKSLYLTVGLHLLQLLFELTTGTGRSEELTNLCSGAAVFRCINQLWEQVTAAIDIGDGRSEPANGPSRALSVFFLTWPLMAIAHSPKASTQMKSNANRILRGS
ncbi:hypothetical protein CB0940_05300 [Cercospora beticola]|uniref:Zn(2)-C6 fungal-type domain-containing protein n=1 Tax=Cercospora beticola TaxID=122368 RepID=A0A2G5HXY5_CERBT|nr:hypothetical protein CB0940_05300 [Cercospora beticola]PIA97143.1 hypothetical protein CB0940_05300 [Cercospora beticola]WPA97835.1 hypothetical protein RHO25_002446 [Cercospora beticola]